MKLTKDEKVYLFSKLEYKKRLKAIGEQNDLFNILGSDGDKNISDDEFKLILKSLEYTFRKRLEGEKPDLNNDIFKSIKDKIPEGFIHVKFSNLAARQKKANKIPTVKDTKKDIITYLDKKGIEHDSKNTKKDLVKLFKEGHIQTFKGFTNKNNN